MQSKKKIQFVLKAPQAQAVGVAGSFNDWDATRTPLRKGKHGSWRAKLSLPTGRHEYRFLVDGNWLSDPKATQSAPNPHGSRNSVVIV